MNENSELEFLDDVKCLYFDDNEVHRERYAFTIENAWNQLKTGVSIAVRQTGSPDEAMKILKESDKYKIFVADIFVTEEGKRSPLGLLTIKTARQDADNAGKHLAIIALTAGNGVDEETVKQNGGNKLLLKDDINKPGNILGEWLLRALNEEKMQLSSSKALISVDEVDLPLVAVVDTIGRRNVANLTEKIVGQRCSTIKASFIRGGLSGASVIGIEWDGKAVSQGKPKLPISKKLLLKVATDGKSLSNELKGSTAGFPHGLFVRYIGDGLVYSGGWHAIGSEFKDEAKTLLDWLIEDRTALKGLDKVLNSLFLDADRGLAQVYSNEDEINTEKYPNDALGEILTASRKARIRLALRELKPLAKKYDPLKVFNENIIKNFLVSARVCQLDKEDFRKKGTFYCWSHGDLHGRNILVSKSGSAFLIDPANIGVMHWASDVARLSVDLIVSGLDAGVKSHEWDNFEKWCNIIFWFTSDDYSKPKGIRKSNLAICRALSWIKDKLRDIHSIKEDQQVKPDWEFRLALGVEFMRSSYRYQELPTPKRVLGLLASCIALRETSAAYKKVSNTYRGA